MFSLRTGHPCGVRSLHGADFTALLLPPTCPDGIWSVAPAPCAVPSASVRATGLSGSYGARAAGVRLEEDECMHDAEAFSSVHDLVHHAILSQPGSWYVPTWTPQRTAPRRKVPDTFRTDVRPHTRKRGARRRPVRRRLGNSSRSRSALPPRTPVDRRPGATGVPRILLFPLAATVYACTACGPHGGNCRAACARLAVAVAHLRALLGPITLSCAKSNTPAVVSARRGWWARFHSCWSTDIPAIPGVRRAVTSRREHQRVRHAIPSCGVFSRALERPRRRTVDAG